MCALRRGTPVLITGRLLTLALTLLLGSCSLLDLGRGGTTLAEGFADLRETARSVIAEPGRRDRFLAHCEALESELLDFQSYATEFAAGYRRAFTDHDVGQDELRRLGAAFRERQRTSQKRFVELHLAMAGAVTGREWQSLQKQEAKIIESLLDAATRKSS